MNKAALEELQKRNEERGDKLLKELEKSNIDYYFKREGVFVGRLPPDIINKEFEEEYINKLKSKLPKKYRKSQDDIPTKESSPWGLEEYSTMNTLIILCGVCVIIGFLMVIYGINTDENLGIGVFFLILGIVLMGATIYVESRKEQELYDYRKIWSQIHAVKNEAIRLREEGPEEEEEQAEKKSRRITQRVRDQVWRRDEGKCIQCGSNEDLEFDHIIPVSKGGANTYRNIQLLCEECNRSKSDKIG